MAITTSNGSIFKFQLTRPRGARPQSAQSSVSSLWFQLTRPRGARPVRVRGVGLRRLVSTHAPARGATSPKPHSERPQSRFNSRAREGRDRLWRISVSRTVVFNSRAREGRDET